MPELKNLKVQSLILQDSMPNMVTVVKMSTDSYNQYICNAQNNGAKLTVYQYGSTIYQTVDYRTKID